MADDCARDRSQKKKEEGQSQWAGPSSVASASLTSFGFWRRQETDEEEVGLDGGRGVAPYPPQTKPHQARRAGFPLASCRPHVLTKVLPTLPNLYRCISVNEYSTICFHASSMAGLASPRASPHP